MRAIVVAMTRDGVIGYDGGMPWRLPEDLARFRALTMGGVVVMGRRTFEAVGRVLDGRENVVLSRGGFSFPGVAVAGSVEEAMVLGAGSGRDVFFCGGSEVYRRALEVADRMYVTWVEGEWPGDTFFPQVDWSAWSEVLRVAGDGCEFVDYIKI